MTDREGCPFCGERERLVGVELVVAPAREGEGGRGERTAVECQKCGALGPWAGTFAEAAEAWNTRAPKPEGAAPPGGEPRNSIGE